MAERGSSPEVEASRRDPFRAIAHRHPGHVQRQTFWPDRALRTAFERYWSLRLAGEVERALALEAPYFQEMVRPGRYTTYMRLTSPAGGESRLELIRLVPKTEHFVEIPLYLYLSGSDGSSRRASSPRLIQVDSPAADSTSTRRPRRSVSSHQSPSASKSTTGCSGPTARAASAIVPAERTACSPSTSHARDRRSCHASPGSALVRATERITRVIERHPVDAAALSVAVAALQRLVRIGHHVRQRKVHFCRGEGKGTAVGEAGYL